MKVKRFSTNGRSHDRAGYEIKIAEGLTIKGDWRTGEKVVNKDLSYRYDPEAERREFAQRKEEQQSAAKRATELLKLAIQSWSHWYIERKCIDHLYPVNVDMHQNLVIPVLDSHDDRLISLQFIANDGSKRFLSGGKKKGGYYLPSGAFFNGQPFGIAEGFATAVSVTKMFNIPCIVAFDAGNLPVVAKAMRMRYPMSVITIYADNDAAGLKAAAECNMPTVIPTIGFNDFNDEWCVIIDAEIAEREREAIQNE